MITVPAESYTIRSVRKGYGPVEQEISVFADTIVSVYLNLPRQPDQDGDGFLDSMDKCIDVYGLYDGCPRPQLKTAFRLKGLELYNELMRDPLTIGWVLAGYIQKVPMKKKFRDFLSNYEGSALNNFRGLVLGNTFTASYKGIFFSLELGQWFGGLKYRHSDTLTLNAGSDNYLIYLDTFALDGSNEPAVYIASTAPAIGIHLPIQWVNVVYSIGYQWENIVLDDLRKASNGARTQVLFSNNWWFHELRAEADIKIEKTIVPSIYFSFKLPFGQPNYTKWVCMQAGVMIKFINNLDRISARRRSNDENLSH
jgi:hypothetical protein